MLLAGNQLRKFMQSINVYITSIGVPEFSKGFLIIPVYLSVVNSSSFSVTLDQIITTFYKWNGSEWANIGQSNPTSQPTKIQANQTTNFTIEPRISILQGLVTSVMSLLSQGAVRYRIGVTVKVGGSTLPEQFSEFQVGQIKNAI